MYYITFPTLKKNLNFKFHPSPKVLSKKVWTYKYILVTSMYLAWKDCNDTLGV